MPIDLTRREQIVSSLDDKTYRDAFVADQIRIGVPLQIKQLREGREWSQTQLGQQMQPPMVQESVWRLENPNKANLTIGTLLRVASAFDVALMVRFVPFSELIDSTPWLTPRDRSVSEFAKDTGLLSPACASASDFVFGPAFAVSGVVSTAVVSTGVSLDMSKVKFEYVTVTTALNSSDHRPAAQTRVIDTQLTNAA